MGVGTGGGGPQMLYRRVGGTLVPIRSRAMFREAYNTWNRDTILSLKNRISCKVRNKRRRVILDAKRVLSSHNPQVLSVCQLEINLKHIFSSAPNPPYNLV